jgi:flavin-binding protein dodecin
MTEMNVTSMLNYITKQQYIKVETRMPVWKIIDVVGISDESFAEAVRNAVIESAKTVRGIKRAEVRKLDVKVEDNKVTAFRAEVRIAFEVER